MPEENISAIGNICRLITNTDAVKFANMLYKDVSGEGLASINPSDLAAAAESMLNLLQDRMPHVTNVNFTKLGQDKDYVVIEVVTKEVPFLVESISNELKSNGIVINLIVHPSFSIERKQKGELAEIGKTKAEREAIMQFFILNQFTDDYYNALKQRIKAIVDCVLVAVQDWEPMRQELRNLIKEGVKHSEPKEDMKFLEWLLAEHFIFLGSFFIANETGKRVLDYDSALGIAKTHLYKEELKSSYALEEPESHLFIKKSNTRSVVHRDDHMNCIYLKSFDKKGNYIGTHIFFGFFTSSVYRKSVMDIPLIREKVRHVLERYGYHESSYNTKELITVLESFSRSDLIQMTEDELFELATGMVSLNLMPRIKVFMRIDNVSHLVHCFIFIPKDRFSSEIMKIIERILIQQIHGSIYRYYVSVGESKMARLQIIIKPTKALKKEYGIKKIEELVTDATSSWLDDLMQSLSIKHNTQIAREKYNKFKDAFDIKYTSNFAAKQAVHDIKMTEAALAENQVKFDFYLSSKSGKDLLQLKVFSPYKEQPLSNTLPILENLGFFVVDTLTFKINLKEERVEKNVFIHYFRLSIKNSDYEDFKVNTKKNIEAILYKIWNDNIENDRLNSLVLYAGLDWREVLMLRAYTSYLKQIKFPYDYVTTVENVIVNAEIIRKVVDLFHSKFNPDNAHAENRNKRVESILKDLEGDLAKIESIVVDKVVRAYVNLVMATKRTNFFKKNNVSIDTSGLSLKIQSSEVNNIPLPKPFFEIFVYSSRFEAVHLRGGRIARGGLRWSDRNDDFRTEVLGLMKAQMTKNSVIVPVGSKGGFVLKRKTDNTTYMQEGIDCYKDFLRGLLDVTDNIIDGNIVPPADVIRYDQDDPYLVVAADKGTASFSDHANGVAREYNFWLDDAFASGGSAGYDHKKMAITSRGAWISAQDHFNSLNINIEKQSFTAVGIGDMSGDVFGNGLLLSKNYKLIAAFNHMHIFLDPNPDPAKSFKERKRLFAIERSKWSDYNTDCISQGGGIFLRNAKTINISDEAKAALGVEASTFTADELIVAILKAPVDMLWNGGIGTYVKSTDEVNENIGDKSNDSVRVNGKELRAKMIIEGGNLGCTQLGRIEYERHNGKINTDFIDNSGGVDCSDHEVNIKIAFAELIRKKTLSLKDRNDLLVQMTDDIAELVLKDNKQQTLLLSMEANRGKQRIAEHFWLMKNLESRGELNRDLEKLPRADDFALIINGYNHLTRSEIAVLIAYAKNSASTILASNPKQFDRFLDQYLIAYFPKLMQEKFGKTLLEHKLKRDIIITLLVNQFINTLGCCLFHKLLEQGYDSIDIIHAFVIVDNSMGCQILWDKVLALGSKINLSEKMALLNRIRKSLKKNILWLLNNKHYLDNIAKAIKEIKDDKLSLIAICRGSEVKDITMPERIIVNGSIPQSLLEDLIDLEAASDIPDVITISRKAGSSLTEAAKAYIGIARFLDLDTIIIQASALELLDYADNMALNAVIGELHEAHNYLVVAVLNDSGLQASIQAKMEWYRDFINEMLKNIHSGNVVSILVLALKRLKEITKNI